MFEKKEATPVIEAAGEAKAKSKRSKKLGKAFEGNVLVVTTGTGTVVKFDMAPLSKIVNDWLLKHGFSQKIGDAAAGKEGKEAVESMQKVYDGLVKGDLTVRAPKTEKINKADVAAKFNALDAAQKAILAKNPDTKALLESLGVKF